MSLVDTLCSLQERYAFLKLVKIDNTDNCIFNGCYTYLYDMCLKNPNDTNNWVCCVRNELCRIGLNNLWHA